MFEFQGVTHPTTRDMIDAICKAWMTDEDLSWPCGVEEYIREVDADVMAHDAAFWYGLEQTDDWADYYAKTWMEKRGVTIDDLIEGFERLKKEYTK